MWKANRVKINPVFMNGIKTRMRGIRAPLLMSVYFGILLGLFTLVYVTIQGESYYIATRPRPDGTEMLMALYTLLICVLFGAVALMVPAMNAGNISAEREKQTLDLLLSSRLSAISIVLGKVFSNMVFVVFLLFLALPLFAVTYLFGSVMLWDIVKAFLYLTVGAYTCASCATFFSALTKKTSVATILTYITQVMFVILTAAVGGFMLVRYQMRDTYDPNYIPILLRINPAFSVLELIASAEANSEAGTDIMGYFLSEEINYSFMLYSGAFMIAASALFNIFAAVLIKPVQKFQLSQKPKRKLKTTQEDGAPHEEQNENEQ